MANEVNNNELEELREEINAIDNELATLLKKRFSVCKKIKLVKEKNNLPITDLAREGAVYERIEGFFNLNYEKVAAKNIYESIIKNCKFIQTIKEEENE